MSRSIPKSKTLRQQHLYTYTSWRCMKERCSIGGINGAKYYQGKGIKVCDRWAESFANFLSDMGERPNNYTLDRIDSSGDYEPGNCRWASYIEQNNNLSHQVNDGSRIPGVRLMKSGKKFEANIKRNGKKIHLGVYPDFFEACCARKAAELIYDK